jgi:putative phage-type endonuclease
MRLIPYKQRSLEWFAARLGIPTASSFDRLITSTGKPSASADGYINQLVAERVTGVAVEVKVTEAMQRGTDLEPEARSLFEFITDLPVRDATVCLHNTLDAGASPDGFIFDDALLEIKCPSAHTHVEYLRDGCLPSKYIAQVQGQLWITGKFKAHFLSYHPDFKPLLVIVNRDEMFIGKLESEVIKALSKIESLVKEFAL